MRPRSITSYGVAAQTKLEYGISIWRWQHYSPPS